METGSPHYKFKKDAIFCFLYILRVVWNQISEVDQRYIYIFAALFQNELQNQYKVTKKILTYYDL